MFCETSRPTARYTTLMTSVADLVQQLRDNGWPLAAIERELGLAPKTVWRWTVGDRHPANAGAVTLALRSLLKRAPPPRRRGNKT